MTISNELLVQLMKDFHKNSLEELAKGNSENSEYTLLLARIIGELLASRKMLYDLGYEVTENKIEGANDENCN